MADNSLATRADSLLVAAIMARLRLLRHHISGTSCGTNCRSAGSFFRDCCVPIPPLISFCKLLSRHFLSLYREIKKRGGRLSVLSHKSGWITQCAMTVCNCCTSPGGMTVPIRCKKIQSVMRLLPARVLSRCAGRRGRNRQIQKLADALSR